MRLGNLVPINHGWPLRIMSRVSRTWVPDGEGPWRPGEETWELTVVQLRYRPDAWLQPPHSVPGWFCEVQQHGPEPTPNGARRIFVSDKQAMDMFDQGSWVIIPNVGPLMGHIEIHSSGTPRWVLRYPTLNSGDPVEVIPVYTTWRHPAEPW